MAKHFTDAVPTPAIVIDAKVVLANLRRMQSYCTANNLKLRPHTKTHKSKNIADMQMGHGATGLTVAKVGEAQVMTEVCDDVLMAYPAVDAARCSQLAQLAHGRAVRVGIDSDQAADALAEAARAHGSTIGILVDLDVGHHRTGVQSPQAALHLAQHVDQQAGLRLDGLMFFPGQVWAHGEEQAGPLQEIDDLLGEVLALWSGSGLNASIVSGGSTPTATQSHRMKHLTEIRPGTYVFNDMNCVRGGFASLEDCAARVVATVVSNAVPGQVVVDAGTKTLTSDRCHSAPDAGQGYVVEYPDARITKLSEEHGQIDVTACGRKPKIGDRVTIIPNHICPCINLQDRVYWHAPGKEPEPMIVDARGRVF